MIVAEPENAWPSEAFQRSAHRLARSRIENAHGLIVLLHHCDARAVFAEFPLRPISPPTVGSRAAETQAPMRVHPKVDHQ